MRHETGYSTGGLWDFVEDVLKGAAKAGIDYVEHDGRDDRKVDAAKSDDKKSAVDKVVDDAKKRVKDVGKKAGTDAAMKYIVVAAVLYLLLKGRR